MIMLFCDVEGCDKSVKQDSKYGFLPDGWREVIEWETDDKSRGEELVGVSMKMLGLNPSSTDINSLLPPAPKVEVRRHVCSKHCIPYKK